MFIIYIFLTRYLFVILNLFYDFRARFKTAKDPYIRRLATTIDLLKESTNATMVLGDKTNRLDIFHTYLLIRREG